MDQIHIENLRLRGKHGHYENERRVEQEFLLDIILDIDTKKAGSSDKLEDTIDYDSVRNSAKETIENTTSYLIENLAQTISEKILEDKRIQKVTLTIKKTEVWDNGVPGVTVTRSQK